MPASIEQPLRPLLRIPPFPGARHQALARACAVKEPVTDEVLELAMTSMGSHRIGGDYWGKQPEIPDTPYILVRIRNEQMRARVLQTMRPSQQVVCCVDRDGEIRGWASPTVSFVRGTCDPWHLVAGATEVFADPDDDLVAIAALSGVSVRTPDAGGQPGTILDPRTMIRARVDGPFAYVSPFTGADISLLEAVELCAHWRDLIDGNRAVSAAIGFASWKRGTARPLLWSGGEVNFSARPGSLVRGDRVFAWKSRVRPSVLTRLQQSGVDMIEVEDGFIRSIGLGAECVPPLSLVVDHVGIYFDPGSASELERLLELGEFSAEMIERAQKLRRAVVAGAISKYAAGQETVARRTPGRVHLLVPGQVEDDRSVRCGGGTVATNIELLRRARDVAPEAYILYKPHPDVEAGHRVGAIPDHLVMQFADEVVRDEPITSLIEMVDEVHVNTSLAGFEALLRGKSVTTHGVPFYAGWGLTRDLAAMPARRTAQRTLEELVAAVLLLYPRYLDPVTGLPCPPEILVQRFVEGTDTRNTGLLVPLRRFLGQLKRFMALLRK